MNEFKPKWKNSFKRFLSLFIVGLSLSLAVFYGVYCIALLASTVVGFPICIVLSVFDWVLFDAEFEKGPLFKLLTGSFERLCDFKDAIEEKQKDVYEFAFEWCK